VPPTGALLDVSALQATASAAGESSHAFLPKAAPSSHDARDRNRGARESPGLREAGVRVCRRTSPTFSCLRRFPVLQLDPSNAGLLQRAGGTCLSLGREGAARRGPGNVRHLPLGKYFKGHAKHLELWLCLSPLSCDPRCRPTLRQSAAGAGLAFFFSLFKGRKC